MSNIVKPRKASRERTRMGGGFGDVRRKIEDKADERLKMPDLKS